MKDRTLPVVQAAGLTKTFRDFWRRPRVEAVKDLNLTIPPGEVFGLLGPNGSGKSTTIKLILGLLYPSHGRIAVFGRPPTDVATKKRIGYLPEESYLYRFLDARETLDFYGRLFRQHGGVRRDRVELLLDMVGLQHEAKRRISEYSKGMARRIGLAQALINDPEFLILDEPTSGLDPMGTRQMKDIIRRLAEMGKTILLSSHLLADVEDVCDRVCILYGGQSQAAGDIRELLSQENLTQITTERLAPETIEQMRALIKRLENKDILSVSPPRDRLENLFLRIVRDAQAAKVTTSGVGQAGAIPDFLGRATSSGEELIQSLIAASDRERAGEPIAVRPVETTAAPSRQVLEQLVSKGRERAREEAPSGPAAPPPAPPPGPPVEADRAVIDGLLGKKGDGHG